MNPAIIVIGGGGHARVVADALLCRGLRVLGFTEPDPGRHGQSMMGLPILGDDNCLQVHDRRQVHLANGLGVVDAGGLQSLRARVQLRLEAAGWEFVSVIHPTATLSRHASVGAGCQLMAACVIQPGAIIGKNVIVNTASVIEHDAHIGDWSHVAPRALVCGQSTVGAGSLVGAGAVVRQSIRLGEQTLVGAGAVVIHDSPGSRTLIGVPARPME